MRYTDSAHNIYFNLMCFDGLARFIPWGINLVFNGKLNLSPLFILFPYYCLSKRWCEVIIHFSKLILK